MAESVIIPCLIDNLEDCQLQLGTERLLKFHIVPVVWHPPLRRVAVHVNVLKYSNSENNFESFLKILVNGFIFYKQKIAKLAF